MPASALISSVFKARFYRKAWAEVAYRLGICERSAKYRLACASEFTADEIAILLRSEDGIHFLAALMADARPKWWVGFLANVAAGDARRALKRQEQKLKEAMNAVESFGDTLERAEAALAFCDEDFMRPHVDGLRAMAGPPHRAVARKT